MDNVTLVLGKGLNFPLVLSGGSVVLSEYQDLIKNSIATILSWSFGIRPFQPRFGSRLEELLGEPNDGITASLARIFIIEAISTWEKRVSLLEVTIGMPEAHLLHVQLVYRIKSTREIQEYNFQYQL